MNPIVHSALILDHPEVAPEHHVLSLQSPEVARIVRPGQFVMLRPEGAWDPLLPRAFSVYHADPAAGIVEILYRVVGRGTHRLRQSRPGHRLSLWGPLGNWFSEPEGAEVILVAGGVGIPPLVFLADRLRAAETISGGVAMVGAATASFLVGTHRLAAAGFRVLTSTDDGSHGHAGRVTELLQHFLTHSPAQALLRIYACGPMPMLRAVARIVLEAGVPSELALEAPMACGIGACLGCTVPRMGGGFARVCREGPVFPAGAIAW